MRKANLDTVVPKRRKPSKDPMVALYRQWLVAQENVRRAEVACRRIKGGVDAPAVLAGERRLARVCDRRQKIEELMAAVQPKSVEGLRVQLDVACIRLVEIGLVSDTRQHMALNAMRTASNAFGLLLGLGAAI